MSTLQGAIVRPSASTLIWGLVLLVVGGAVAQLAQYQAIQAALNPYGGDNSAGLMWVGAIVAVVGLVATLFGVHQLATNVDALAREGAASARTHQA